MIYHSEKKFHFWLRPQTSYIWHVVIDAECLILKSYLMSILMKLKGLYLWPFLDSLSRYSSCVSCCLLVTKSATMKPLPVLQDGSWIFSPVTLSRTAIRPWDERANQEPPSFPGSRSRPVLLIKRLSEYCVYIALIKYNFFFQFIMCEIVWEQYCFVYCYEGFRDIKV